MKLLIWFIPILFALPTYAKDTKILFLGDSLTAGYGISMKDAFPNQTQVILNQEGHSVEVVNGGQSGATSASGLKRLDWYLRAKPSILVLALGANDGLRSLAPEETEKNLREIIRRAQAKGLKVILTGMKIPPNYGPEYTKKFEDVFPRVAKEEKVPFIPFLLEGVGGEPTLNLPDQIHPNEKGHKKIAQLIAKKIKEVLHAARPKSEKKL